MSLAFETVTLELSAEAIWNPSKVEAALDAIEEYELDGLVFHEADVFNKFVYPSNFDPRTSEWTGTKRRGVWAIVNTRAYLADVARKCAARGVEFFLEVKELGYPEEFIEDNPDVVVEGVVCPTHPAWPALLERRYTETCELLPGLTGFIISVGTLEGRTSLTTRRCRCERCASADAIEWHRAIVEAIHSVTERFRKKLVVREFSYNPEDQAAVVAGLSRLDDDIEYMVKPYARDYYLPWPDNPALVAVQDRTKWLEYDCHGQYFGWGVFPLPVLEDQVARFASAVEAGCSVVQLRVDWERINGLWALDTFGKVNVATAAVVARHPGGAPEEVLAAALRGTGVVRRGVGAADAKAVAKLWLQLYPIALRVLYVAGNVYNTSSQIPSGVAQGWSYMHTLNSMRGWEGPSIGSLDVADPEVVQSLLDEKSQALTDYLTWHAQMQEWQASGALALPDPCNVGDVLEWSLLYVRAFVASAQVVVLVRASGERGLTEQEIEQLTRSADDLNCVRSSMAQRYARGGYSHHPRLLVDPQHLDSMLASAQAVLHARAVAVVPDH